MIPSDTIVIVPTKRPPPIRTFVHYRIPECPVLVVADPEVYDAHVNHNISGPQLTIIKGAYGLGAQMWECYKQAALHGYKWWFRLDDDLSPLTFIDLDRVYPNITEVVQYARWCVEVTDTTLAGFANTTNTHWLKDEYTRTWGLIAGLAVIACSALDPAPYIDRRIIRGEDVYRSCSHRVKDGAVGRVAFVGVDKSDATMDSSAGDLLHAESRQIILDTFGSMVTCNGTRWIHNDTVEIPNWKLHRGGNFRA